MAIKDAFIAELKHESALTKKMLERVPYDKQDWKPHDKSMTSAGSLFMLPRSRIGSLIHQYRRIRFSTTL